MKEAKVNVASNTAARARQEGRTVFLYRYNIPAHSTGFSGPVDGAAEVIESVEQAGWALWQIAYDGAQSKHGAVMLLFRAR